MTEEACFTQVESFSSALRAQNCSHVSGPAALAFGSGLAFIAVAVWTIGADGESRWSADVRMPAACDEEPSEAAIGAALLTDKLLLTLDSSEALGARQRHGRTGV